MSNTRLGVTNLLAAGTIANGTGGGPARSEVAPFVMDRVLIGDRRSLWIAGAQNADTGTTWEIVFNLGSSKSFSMASLHAVEGVGLTQVNVGKYTSYPSTRVSIGNMVQNGRDWGMSFASESAQYVSYKVSGTDLVSVGGGFLGVVSDLGVIGLPDFITTPRRIRTEIPQTDGDYIVNDTGRMGHEFEMTFYAKDLTELGVYEALINTGGSIVLLDERDRCFEVLVVGGALPTRRRFTGYQVTLQMVRRP